MTHPFRIMHDPSGDEAEADSKDAAIVAARTLLEDNEFDGSCRIWRGPDVVDVVWAMDYAGYTHISTRERR